MKQSKRFLSLLTSFVMLICLLPTSAFANENIQAVVLSSSSAESVQVGYVTLSYGEYTTDGTTKATGTPSGTGYAYYNNGVLSLNYFYYEGGGDNDSVIYADNAFDIEAEGVNTINSTALYAIKTEDGDLTISGGELNLQVASNESSVFSAITLKKSYGSSSGGTLTIQNSVLNVELSATSANSYTISLINTGNCTIKNSSVTMSLTGSSYLYTVRVMNTNLAVQNSALLFSCADGFNCSDIYAVNKSSDGKMEITDSYVAVEGSFTVGLTLNSGSYTFNSGTLIVNGSTQYGAIYMGSGQTFTLPSVDYWWRTSSDGSFTKNGYSYNRNSYLEITTINPNSTCDHSESNTQSGCTYSAICSVCGGKIPATGHTWDEGLVTKAATCTEEGVKTYTCTVCGETKTETIDATGHSYEAVVTEPTCTTGGYTTYTCSVCGDSYTADETEATGHSWDEGTVTTEATCTEDGEKTYTCSACGDSYTADETEATGHTWDEGTVTTAATCTEDGVKTYTCTVCGETKTEKIEATGHSYEAVVTEPTCTAGGYTTYTCSVCGDSYTADETEATGHTWDEGTVTTEATSTTSGVKTYTCTECGKTYTEEIQATGSTEDNSDATTSPQTGDNSHLWLWIVLILSGGSCMICISSVRRRKNH